MPVRRQFRGTQSPPQLRADRGALLVGEQGAERDLPTVRTERERVARIAFEHLHPGALEFEAPRAVRDVLLDKQAALAQGKAFEVPGMAAQALESATQADHRQDEKRHHRPRAGKQAGHGDETAGRDQDGERRAAPVSPERPVGPDRHAVVIAARIADHVDHAASLKPWPAVFLLPN
jgi:hypothetical protein